MRSRGERTKHESIESEKTKQNELSPVPALLLFPHPFPPVNVVRKEHNRKRKIIRHSASRNELLPLLRSPPLTLTVERERDKRIRQGRYFCALLLFSLSLPRTRVCVCVSPSSLLCCFHLLLFSPPHSSAACPPPNCVPSNPFPFLAHLSPFFFSL